MSIELQIFKQNRINELTAIFNSNVVRLNSNLVMNITNIHRSRFRNKQQLLYALISKYYNDINIYYFN